MPKSEIKTRRDLILNRATQLFTTFNIKDPLTPTNNEINLFKFLISQNISTIQRTNNFIVWGLQLTQSKDLREFIINKLWWSLKNNHLSPNNIHDDKLLKALLWLNLVDLDNENSIENLSLLCQYFDIKKSDFHWNAENELQCLLLQSCTDTAKQKAAIEKTSYRLEHLAQNCIESSMIHTRRVAESQVCR